MSYEEVRVGLCRLYPGWTFDTIDNMSFEQIESALNEGKKPKGLTIESHEQLADINKNWRLYYGI